MQLSPLTPLSGTPLPTLQTSTPVQSTPNPMQPTAATPIAAPVYVPAVQQNFQQAHQTFDALAGQLAQGQTGIGYAAAPTQATGAASQVSGRYSVGGGYVTDTPAESAPVPSEQFGPPAPNFTPYNGGYDMGPQTGSLGPYAHNDANGAVATIYNNNPPVPVVPQMAVPGVYDPSGMPPPGSPNNIIPPYDPLQNPYDPGIQPYEIHGDIGKSGGYLYDPMGEL